MIEIAKLSVTQESLRQNWSQLYEFAYKIKYENLKFPAVALTEFEDGSVYIHDGHHRAFACVIAGKTHFLENEYFIKKWTYQDYIDINREQNWVTPFDPRTHLRIGNFFDFKNTALSLTDEEVRANLHKYTTNKCFDGVANLCIKHTS